MKKNIRWILVGELILFIGLFLFTLLLCGGGLQAVLWFVDLPSIMLIVLILIPGLIMTGDPDVYLEKFFCQE